MIRVVTPTAYQQIETPLANGRCVILDGDVGSEIDDVSGPPNELGEPT